MSKFKVSSYNPQTHRDEVLAIFKSRPDIFPNNEITQITEESKFPSEEIHHKIVAKIDNKVAGYICALLDSSENLWSIDWLAVSKEFQRQGVGSLLVNSIIDWLRKNKVDKLQVQTCSCGGETVARAFYTDKGFVSTRTEKDGYGVGHSKITFLKQL